MNKKAAIIIGAGPAGLTVAYELIEKTDITPVIYEMSGDIGGISKTVNYKGNRIDIGGHRFFSKSDRVMQWWQDILPLQGAPSRDDVFLNRKVPCAQNGPDPEKSDLVMLVRRRQSRIFSMRRFFHYPIALNLKTFSNLGLKRIMRILLSYLRIRLAPITRERSLEDFFINRFGRELYLTFFKEYTEKVWGVPCSMITPEWGTQRTKGLAVTKAISHALRNTISKDPSITQKKTETSLIGQFMYPKFGPGQLWEEVGKIIQKKGGELHLKHAVTGLKGSGNRMTAVEVRNEMTGDVLTRYGDYVFSTMPVRELVLALHMDVPQEVQEVARGLIYRDFITVGLLLTKLKIENETVTKSVNNIVPDTWIYIQERDVKLGRLQIFNNWSPYMVSDENTVWIGLEYFCTEGDALWRKPDDEFARFAIDELAEIGFIEKEDVLDSVVIRMKKTYPAYFGTYEKLHIVRSFVDRFENLYLIGRNGMHRYNNMDHSMLTAMRAVENIINGIASKENIWAVNAEAEYHEEK